MTSEITVSIFMLTFNQENLVAQAIEGVLKQKTNFKFQLVIGDDGSTDDTIKICKAYQEKFGDVIKLITRDKNIGLIANFIETAKYLTGKYVAICDGDDYWTDYYKLQKQVDFLDRNDDYSITFGKCYRLDSKGKLSTKITNFDKTTFDFSDLVMTNFIPSVTVLFRNSARLRNLPSWFSNLPYGDWPVYLYTLNMNSKIFFLDEYLAVYRVEIGESFKLRKKLSNTFKTDIYILENLSKDCDFEKSYGYFKKAIVKKKKSLILAYNREQDYIKGFQEFSKLLFINKDLKFLKLYFYSLIKTFNV
ncbi:glycosyltransferase [Zunongwangia sp. HGR-M22]|uniref:glycosyltransferase n=1 Tax=Zunongwangia sp. HGR-M22 TaxID=3015168 RepID=UPI0022DDC15F|nr:glycosyltransferase [Zunongwangia sp. HGR-M22]WBL24862.1 glycosyltransferase [Zunongwangia sp. HGR-M22]